MRDHTAQLLLDTHVWLWALSGDERLKRTGVVETIERAAQAGGVLISAISVWELAMLEARGRIPLSKDCLAWIKEALGLPGTVLVPLTPEISVASTRLPGHFHGDPADRIIVATAIVHGAKLVTSDARILAYGRKGFVDVVAP